MKKEIPSMLTFLTIKQAAEDPNLPFTQLALRNYIYRNKKNGFEPCIRHVGKRVLIIKELMIQWILDHDSIGK